LYVYYAPGCILYGKCTQANRPTPCTQFVQLIMCTPNRTTTRAGPTTGPLGPIIHQPIPTFPTPGVPVHFPPIPPSVSSGRQQSAAIREARRQERWRGFSVAAIGVLKLHTCYLSLPCTNPQQAPCVFIGGADRG
jgi:hypothetical protein